MSNKPIGQELIRRYRSNYRISEDAYLSEDMITKHWKLERFLTQKLLESQVENRWEIFKTCYNTLYRELNWLNLLIDSKEDNNIDQQFENWLKLIGPGPKKIFEIGSGKGELLRFLAARDYQCRGSEITLERGRKWIKNEPNITWSISDGVNLAKYEPENYYDTVISDQVIEHLHPDDIVDHFRGVYRILIDGGRYIFKTPHVHYGPSDISLVFKCSKPMGMHLKEYSYRELFLKLRYAGFRIIWSPPPLRRKLDKLLTDQPFTKLIKIVYLTYLVISEQFINFFPKQSQRKKAVKIMSRFYFSPNITLIAQK